MGILNVTPDSFSDAGRYESPDGAVAHALRMFSDGAAIVDVGPESTRPGSLSVDAGEQIRRAIPVIERILSRHPDAVLSIDTRLAEVAAAAIKAGARMVNDTSALRDDPELATVVAESRAALVLMHRKGVPADMQAGGGPQYDDVVGEIRDFFGERIAFAVNAGIAAERIMIDPGLGFGKRTEHNLEILRRLREFATLGRPLLVGASRKRFIGEITGVDRPDERLAGSLACALIAVQAGAAVVRVHDVTETVELLRMWTSVHAT